MAHSSRTKLKSSFNFGSVMAENDPLLHDAYYDNGDYEALASHDDPHCFLVGRTGSGKSAALRRLAEEFPDRIVRIIPENLSLEYLSQLELIDDLLALGVRMEVFFTALWKHVLLVEIIKHRYDITTPEKRQSALNALKDRLRRDVVKNLALDYFVEFGDKFWCETDERVKQITDNLAETFKVELGAEAMVGVAKLKTGGNYERSKSQEVRRELATKFQHIVNRTQLPRLNQMIGILGEEILDSPHHFTYLVVDDLDTQWVDERLANLLIRCLFQAVVDMQKVTNLKLLIALRTNIFEQLGYGEQSRGGQEEKFRGLTMHIHWRYADLEALLENRASAASRLHNIQPIRALRELLPKNSTKDGDALSYILQRTLMRPRDAITYLNACFRESAGQEAITWTAIHQAEQRYSAERLLALRDEWKEPYIDIDKVLYQFREQSAKMERDELTLILDEVALLISNEDFRGRVWLEPLCRELWSKASWSWNLMYGPMVQLLYRIAFLGIAANEHARAVYAYDNPDLALSVSSLGPNKFFEVHPAFHQALNMEKPAVKK